MVSQPDSAHIKNTMTDFAKQLLNELMGSQRNDTVVHSGKDMKYYDDKVTVFHGSFIFF